MSKVNHILTKEFLIEEYTNKKKTIKTIAQEMRIAPSTITKYLLKFSIENRGKRKYFLNEDYFKNWSSNMAYILGFLSADGSLSNNYCMSIALAIKDKSVLIFIKEQLSSEHPIKEIISNGTQQASLLITSKIIFEDLSKYGIVPNKTHILDLPNIPEEFKYDYLRGFFDGDGGIGYTQRKGSQKRRAHFRLTNASLKYLEKIQNKMFEGKGYLYKYKNKECYEFRLDSTNDIIYFCEKMYDSHKFCLGRKYEKFVLIKAFRDSFHFKQRKPLDVSATGNKND